MANAKRARRAGAEAAKHAGEAALEKVAAQHAIVRRAYELFFPNGLPKFPRRTSPLYPLAEAVMRHAVLLHREHDAFVLGVDPATGWDVGPVGVNLDEEANAPRGASPPARSRSPARRSSSSSPPTPPSGTGRSRSGKPRARS